RDWREALRSALAAGGQAVRAAPAARLAAPVHCRCRAREAGAEPSHRFRRVRGRVVQPPGLRAQVFRPPAEGPVPVLQALGSWAWEPRAARVAEPGRALAPVPAVQQALPAVGLAPAVERVARALAVRPAAAVL